MPTAAYLNDHPEKYRRLLLSWFDVNKRELPWRRRRTLYGTWISEMMLQQTTVKVVVPYWEKFLAVFPDVETLAAADPDEVLSLWAGLGYYRRARQLHEAARMVADKMEGKLPREVEGWLALPGIGPYAGGAVASIGLGIRVPAVDANARRVLSRWLVGDTKTLADLKPAHLDRVAAGLVDEERPGDWNEAVMELGALVCRAGDPRCPVCPVRSLCRAHQAGIVDQVPPAKSTAAAIGVQLGLLLVRRQEQVLLLPPGAGPVAGPADVPPPVRADVSGLHAGLWGLPSTPWLPRPVNGAADWPGRFWRSWLHGVPIPGYSRNDQDPVLVGSFRHQITRYRLLVSVYDLRLAEGPDHPGDILAAPPEHRDRSGVVAGSSSSNHKQLWARFFDISAPECPVSNLVAKSLRLAKNSSV
ncbi:MAG: A/G-specific adenine glycosylase [Candidatus Krumholzibacteriota bacterium]